MNFGNVAIFILGIVVGRVRWVLGFGVGFDDDWLGLGLG